MPDSAVVAFLWRTLLAPWSGSMSRVGRARKTCARECNHAVPPCLSWMSRGGSDEALHQNFYLQITEMPTSAHRPLTRTGVLLGRRPVLLGRRPNQPTTLSRMQPSRSRNSTLALACPPSAGHQAAATIRPNAHPLPSGTASDPLCLTHSASVHQLYGYTTAHARGAGKVGLRTQRYRVPRGHHGSSRGAQHGRGTLN